MHMVKALYHRIFIRPQELAQEHTRVIERIGSAKTEVTHRTRQISNRLSDPRISTDEAFLIENTYFPRSGKKP